MQTSRRSPSKNHTQIRIFAYSHLMLKSIIASLLTLLALSAHAQRPDTSVQHQAMAKLSFLVGQWQGPATVTRGPGAPIKITQTEQVEYRLDGLVILIQGTGRDDSGKTLFQALATIAFDETTSTYRIRAYNDGRYVDAELKALPDGFEWSYGAPGFTALNAMHLTSKGEWAETTTLTLGAAPPRKMVDMLLQHAASSVVP